MNAIDICEANNLPYQPVMVAVEEFVDSMVDDATAEMYEATVKRMFGEVLTHDEIMMGLPYCSQSDLIIIERDVNMDNINGATFSVSPMSQVRQIMTKLRLGRKGLQGLYKVFQKMLDIYPDKSDSFLMAKASQIAGIPLRDGQILLTKYIQGGGHLKEFYLNMADEVLMEETPVNTSAGGMPDRKPTDGGKTRLGVKKVKRRKGDNVKEKESYATQ